jgi:hypothetical protein
MNLQLLGLAYQSLLPVCHSFIYLPTFYTSSKSPSLKKNKIISTLSTNISFYITPCPRLGVPLCNLILPHQVNLIGFTFTGSHLSFVPIILYPLLFREPALTHSKIHHPSALLKENSLFSESKLPLTTTNFKVLDSFSTTIH